MSPAELAAVNLRALRAEVLEARGRLQQLAAEIEAVDPGAGATLPRAEVALLVVDLHSYYTLLEALLGRIVVALEGQTPAGPSSHAALLRHATRDIEGVRCAVLRRDSLVQLEELRRARHLFRHAYALELDLSKMRPALDSLHALHPIVTLDLDCFAAFLERLIGEIEQA